ncbi:MAG TPA: RNA-binding protein [Candidatus Portnoybacteria bacterium]|nr:RNA-binding protein [Candidatus Portnoybacteria bacterium]
MGNKLYVGNLSYDTTDEGLKELFSTVGTVVSATIITDKFSGRSKGFGFVEMSSSEEAQKAKDELNGKDLDGRNINVDEAKPMEKKPFRKSFQSGNRFGGNNRRY